MPADRTPSQLCQKRVNTNTLASVIRLKLDFAVSRVRFHQQQLKKEDNGKGCHIPDKVPRKDGYVRIAVTKGSFNAAYDEENRPKVAKEETFYLHQLAWYAAGNRMPSPVTEHLSHLCGDSRCFNVAHLPVESPRANNQRKNCAVAVRCPNDDCGQVIWMCTHEPRCIPLMSIMK